MKPQIISVLCCAIELTVSAYGQAGRQDDKTTLCVVTDDALEKTGKALATIDEVVAKKNLDMSTAFATAEAAFLLGANPKAISILERVVREFPKSMPPRLTLPAEVIGRLWIGTYARHGGDPARAEAAYREVLSILDADHDIKCSSPIRCLCYLYLAEIESHFYNQPAKSLAFLGKIEQVARPADKNEASLVLLYQNWARHEVSAPTNKQERQSIESKQPHLAESEAVWGTLWHLSMCGYGDTGDLRASHPSGMPRHVFVDWPLRRAAESNVSRIDRAFAQCCFGYFLEQRKSPSEAIRYYSDLFESNAYLAPQGGLGLARCQHAEGKNNDAKQTLQKLSERFPSYKEHAQARYKEWFGTPN